MSSNTNQNNEKYFQKLAVIQTYVLDIVEAETFEEVAKHVFDSIEATIDPFLIVVGQVRFGAIRGLAQQKGEEMRILSGDADGMPLDGPGIIVRAVNTRKVYNVPDTREDSSYFEAWVKHASGVHTLSEIAVPILVQGKSIGVINIEEAETNAFDESDQKILEVLSRYAGVSLNNILYTNRLNGLHKHSSQLSTLTSIGEVAEQTLDAMTYTLELETCAFLLPQEGVFQKIYEKGLEKSIQLREKALNFFTRIQTAERMREADDIEFLSELEVPINVDDEVVAILSAKSIQPDKYTEQDKQLLEILASHVASAIQRIRLLEEQIQYEAKLEALHLHTTKLADAENIEEISEHTIEAMETTLGFSFAVFNIVEDEIWRAMVRSHSGVRRYGEKHPGHIDGPGIGARAIRTGETQLVNDVRKDVDYIGPFMNENTFSKLEETHQKEMFDTLTLDPNAGKWMSLSELDVPVKIDQTVVAVLNAESNELNAFTEQDMYLLETLASHVASAVQRIRLQEEQQKYEAKLEALHASASRLVFSDSQEDMWRVTHEITRVLFDYEHVSLGFVQDNQLRYLYNPGDEEKPTLLDPNEELAVLIFDLLRDNTVTTRAVKTAEIQDIPDTSLDPDFLCTVFDDDGEPVLKSEYTVPIIHYGQVVAILNAESEKLNAFSEQDKKLLETLASIISAALMRLKVTEELVLERVRVEQANELDRMKNQFISTATHELRTPVTSIIGFLELVLDYSSEELPDSVRKDLNVVFRNAMRLVDMTNDLLDVQRITSGRFVVTLEQVELINTLNEVVEELTPLFNDKHQTLFVNAPKELIVDVDETRISQLFINLLRNANKFTPEEGTIEITVEPYESYVQISIKDSGIGLSEEDIGKLFKPFPFIQHEVNVSSTGLGLAICKGIVDIHNGEIWAESEGKGMGSTFFVRIPVKH